MLEWIETKEGYYIPKVDGKWMCSARDPHKEARVWLDLFADLLYKVESIFVLGLAGGYQVELISKTYPALNIFVIENNKELSDSWLEKNTTSEIKIFASQKLEQLKNKIEISEALKSIYLVARNPSSIQHQPDYYKDIENWLLARDWEHIEHHLALRPEQSSLLKKIKNKNSPIEIKKISESLRFQELTHVEMLWLSLRELVK